MNVGSLIDNINTSCLILERKKEYIKEVIEIIDNQLQRSNKND